MQLLLTLRYAHGVGELAPYFDGVARGVAVATRCPHCAQAWFQPRLVCPKAHGDLEWIELPGTGVVRTVTFGPGRLPFDGDARQMVLALVAMDGATNLALGRIEGASDVRNGDRVRLVPDRATPGGHAWGAVFEVVARQ